MNTATIVENIINSTPVSNLEKLLTMSGLAYRVGYEQKTKTNLKREKLLSKVRAYSVRNVYTKMIWEAYKAGRYAANKGDK